MSYYYTLRDNSIIPFVMTIDTTIAGATANDTFKMPIVYNPNFTLDYGDGSTYKITSASDPNLTHQYASGGVYQIKIYGALDYFAFQLITQDNDKVISIDQWGGNRWTTGPLFQNCSNVQGNWSDSPDLSIATSIGSMFSQCTSFNYPINFTSNTVTSAEYFLENCSSFDQAISLDMPNMLSLRGFVYECGVYNSTITFTDTSNVTDMHDMFYRCYLYNQSVSSIDTSSLVDAGSMFYYASAFNKSVSHFSTGNVTNMNSMFYECDAFNQSVSHFLTSNVTDMSFMFNGDEAFNQDVSGWIIASLVTAQGMLSGASTWSTANLDALLINWYAQPHLNNGNFSCNTSYTTGGAAEAGLNGLVADGWTIQTS